MKTSPLPPSAIVALLLLGAAALPAVPQTDPVQPESAAVPHASKPPEVGRERPETTPGDAGEASDAGGTQTARTAGKMDDFARADTDRDGRVSPKEYAASDIGAIDMVAAGERSGTDSPHGGFSFRNNESRPDRSKFFRSLDKDDNGFLSREEFESKERPKE